MRLINYARQERQQQQKQEATRTKSTVWKMVKSFDEPTLLRRELLDELTPWRHRKTYFRAICFNLCAWHNMLCISGSFTAMGTNQIGIHTYIY